MFVAYLSFLFCRRMNWDFEAAARGGLLHDLFLYNWRDKGSHKGMHGFTHPKAALKNAAKVCDLSAKEQDIIAKHMWPLTIQLPRYKESYVVCFADKVCAIAELCRVYRLMRINQKLQFAC